MAGGSSPAEAERQLAKALARWEGEGGALAAPRRRNEGVKRDLPTAR